MEFLTRLKEWFPVLPRMGGFSSAPKDQEDLDIEDDEVTFPTECMTASEMETHCQQQLADLSPLITRQFTHYRQPTDSSADKIRVMQWNALSQALGVHNDNFTQCPAADLSWTSRRYRIIEEISHYAPDILCLQEVDHFKFFKKALGTMGYDGVFFPKPYSPCLDIKGNNGPDGCALFFRAERFELLRTETRNIEVWMMQSNQVAVLCLLRDRPSGVELCAVTTHLKARPGALNSAVRSEQGKDVLTFVAPLAGDRPVLLCGDFNAEPSEPVYGAVTGAACLPLVSAYRQATGAEPEYTTWKIRATGEACHTLDYVFVSEGRFVVTALLPPPSGAALGEGRAPCLAYPSDHFSLVVDLRILPVPG